jgi:hypothetical protein
MNALFNHDLLCFYIVAYYLACISWCYQGLVLRAPNNLSYIVIDRRAYLNNFFNFFGIFLSQNILKVEDSNERFLIGVVQTHQKFVAVWKWYLFWLQAWHINSWYNSSITNIINMKSDCCGSCNQVFAVFCNVNWATRFFNVENTDSYELVGFIHTHGTVIGARKQKVTF